VLPTGQDREASQSRSAKAWAAAIGRPTPCAGKPLYLDLMQHGIRLGIERRFESSRSASVERDHLSKRLPQLPEEAPHLLDE
jgi:hypothetical protein